MSLFLRRMAFLAISFAVLGGAPAAMESRKALVIGNARYEPAVGALRNTGSDAKAVAQTLRDLGFAVTERHNLNRTQLLEAVDDFRRTLDGTEVALFFYAGHGISVAGSNYLIPLKSDFDPESAKDETTLRMLAETRLFNAEQAVADMSASGARCNIMILDACRTTPLARTGRTRSWSAQGGLSEMTPPAGSLIAFATDAGRTALDGEGSNGLYTEELLKHMRTPGLTVEQVFKRARAGVLARTEGEQVPAEYSRLVGDDIYLAGKSAPETPDSSKPQEGETLPSAAQLVRLAEAGKTRECLSGLQLVAEAQGAGDYAAQPLETLLERVKIDLASANKPSPSVAEAEATCALVLRVLPECLPLDHPYAAGLFVKAHNRRGDALILLGRPQEALQEFDAAIPLAPNDAYILYNRGRAHLALGNKNQARADFLEAAGPRFNQPGAKKLAEQALARMK